MNEAQFRNQLSAEGFTEIETRQFEPRNPRGEHGHEYTIRGLVMSGQFSVVQDQKRIDYGPGQIFEVAKDDPHDESIGPDGAQVIVGKKYT